MTRPIEEIKKFKQEKLKKWQQAGIEPFPEKVQCQVSISEILKNFSKFLKKKKLVSLCGRIVSFRNQGKIVFFNLKGEKEKIQIVFKKDSFKKNFKFLKENLEIGDLVAIKGEVFLTKRKEKSILAKKITLATKALLSLPSEWYGLSDTEERFRKRYLDLILNKKAREKFDLRWKIIYQIRKALYNEGFLEVETPILQPLWGGANAKPFITHHNVLKKDLYLRIAPELYLKRLLVGGYEKIFEIGKNFRNEGIDKEHNPEFSMMELYWAWKDAEFLRKFVEKFIKKIVGIFYKDKKIIYQNKKIDFSKKFKVVDIVELVKKETSIDFENDSKEEIIQKVKKIDSETKEKKLLKVGKETAIGLMFDAVFKKVCRPKIIQPTFTINYPWEISPLAKKNPKNPKRVSRFQLIISGMEIVNAFSELNDPLEQEKRFKEQEKLRKAGDSEAQTFDKDFVEALKYGMPPTAGLGLGLDRLIMLLTDSSSLKEAILFPILKDKKI